MRAGKGAFGLPPKAQRNAEGSVMGRPANRRVMLSAAGVAAVIVIAGAASAQSADISGTVGFEGGAVVPKGEIEIYIEDRAVHDDARRRAATTRVRSDGASRTINFSFSPPTSSTASPGAQIVARLERADGWLLARGRAQSEIDSPVRITLYTVMY